MAAKSPYGDLPEVFKKYLPPMFAAYPKHCHTKPSSWFAWTGEKVIAHNLAACHAHLCYDGNGWDELITAVPKSDELSLEYLRMLIRGPFRSMSDLIRLDRIKANYYLHCLSLDKWPANVLMNFCIASRVPIEFDLFLKPWAKRVEAGFNDVLAFLLTYSYGSDYNDSQHETRTFNVARGGHLWLDPGSSWPNIMSGSFINLSKPFKTHAKNACPTNNIWGYSVDWSLLRGMTDEEIAAFYTQPIQVIEPPPPHKPKVFVKKQNPHMINVIPAGQFQFQPPVWALANQDQPFPDPLIEVDDDDEFDDIDPD